LTAAETNDGRDGFVAAKAALLFPFPELHEEALARLSRDRSRKVSNDTKAAEDAELVSLLVMRLPSLLRRDGETSGTDETPRKKAARAFAVETVLAASEVGPEVGPEVSFAGFLRTDDALTAFAVSAFASARRYDDAARVLVARLGTHESLVFAADAAPALVQRFLASKRAFDDSDPSGGGGFQSGGVTAFAAAAARRLAADARAEGARALAKDLR
jgi:hypothetical protein